MTAAAAVPGEEGLLLEVAGLLLIVLIGVTALVDGTGEPSRALDFKAGDAPIALVFSGAALAFYALIGFEDSANVAEEVTEPRRAYPVALFGGLAVALVAFICSRHAGSPAAPR